jgi:hypothetical protein
VATGGAVAIAVVGLAVVGSAGAEPAPTCPDGLVCRVITVDGQQGLFLYAASPTAVSSVTPTSAPSTRPTLPSTTKKPARGPSSRATTRPSAPARKTTTTGPLPGAVDVDALQREAEKNGYGAPLPERKTGVVPAPGCNGANAQPPDGHCATG